jgi:hypothetical protein
MTAGKVENKNSMKIKIPIRGFLSTYFLSSYFITTFSYKKNILNRESIDTVLLILRASFDNFR